MRHLFPGSRRPLLGALTLVLACGACSDETQDPPVVPQGLTGDCAPGTFPRLVMCPNEVAVARSRLARWPYDGMYKRIKAAAAGALVKPGARYDKDVESKNAGIARSAAMVALMENDKAMAAKAIDGVTRMQSNWEFGLGLGSTDLFIRIVGPLQDGLEALDLILGGGFATAAQRASMEKALGDIADKLHEMWIIGPGRLVVMLCQNNYNTKLSTTLGLAALMLDTHKQRETWLRFAATEANRFYGDGVADKNLYLSAEGVCKEPPGYFNFGGRAAMPFAILYEYMVGKGASYTNDCSISTGDCDSKKKLTIDGILHSQRLVKAHEWMVKIQLPDGRRPSIDEGRVTGVPAGGALWHYVDPKHTLTLWDHVFANPGDAVFNTDYASSYLARVDFSAAPRMAKLDKAQLFSKSGQVVFRSGWDSDAIYALVLGESGLMRSQVHNHTDATSFQLWAYGEMLAMDTGYFEPPGEDHIKSRAKTVGPEAHNLILVDGKGADLPTLVTPGDVDATIKNSLDRDGLDYTEVHASYQDVSFVRGVLFASESYLVISDTLSAKAAHKYSWRLHGNGGGSSIRKNYEVGSFTLGSDNAVWSRSKAKLMLVLDSTHGQPTLSSDTFPHEWVSGQEGYHRYVDGVISTTTARPNVSFLGVVFPQKAGSKFPAIKVQDAGSESACITVSGEGFADLLAARAGGKSAEITVTGFSTVRSDAAFLWIVLASDGTVQRALIRGGKQLSYGGKLLIDNSAGKDTAIYEVKK